MSEFPAIGDLVVRKSYDADVIFKVVSLYGSIALLKGVYSRVIADAPLDDLVKVDFNCNEIRREGLGFGILRKMIS
ncbi:MAG: hypothetical protein GX969_03045 [Firmicutes bacterium]|nr:hypothetical protein [Bacillota bacterium]